SRSLYSNYSYGSFVSLWRHSLCSILCPIHGANARIKRLFEIAVKKASPACDLLPFLGAYACPPSCETVRLLSIATSRDSGGSELSVTIAVGSGSVGWGGRLRSAMKRSSTYPELRPGRRTAEGTTTASSTIGLGRRVTSNSQMSGQCHR